MAQYPRGGTLLVIFFSSGLRMFNQITVYWRYPWTPILADSRSWKINEGLLWNVVLLLVFFSTAFLLVISLLNCRLFGFFFFLRNLSMPTSRWKFTEFRLPSRLWIVLKKLNLWMCEICENPSMLVKKKHPRTISLRVIIFAAHEESGIFCRGGLSIFSMRDPPTSDVDPWPEYFLLRTLGNSVFLSWISLVCERRKENYLLYGIEKWSSRSILRFSESIRALKNETAVFELDNFHDNQDRKCDD